MVPVSCLKTGFNFAIDSTVAVWRIPSSAVTETVSDWGCVSEGGFVTVTGTISWAKRLDFWAREARVWDKAPKASWSAREML